MFRSFCMANNLRNLADTHLLTEILQELAPCLEQTFNGDSRNPAPTLADLGLPADEAVVPDLSQSTPLSPALYDALLRRLSSDAHLSERISYRSFDTPVDLSTPILNPNAQILPAVMHRGRRYTNVAHNAGDSQVVYLRAHGATTLNYGQIQSIFLHQRYIQAGEMRQQVFAVVRAYRALSAADSRMDPYRAHRGLGARLVYARLEPVLEVIPMQYIVSHYVSCPYDPVSPPNGNLTLQSGCLVVVALDEGWNY
ncbi:uncharacterized protein TRAVEDRAFT_54873 [Trametes versicolor FP-101664 SS1]|uniref:Uncharacterized protein n=1 Tax=Trametes versicolor (strain FP-101664) TaxID=717944 RepID=R7S6G1_TRAVS|nr:uncharacterized protein TRAVEDRAFT_54873 [Trametes versicolor FP-101664 SS1]EIW51125.1 hypothetical protein TRAVEDRAFT_54873 [Trametes versicolor FP-101664 SS1]